MREINNLYKIILINLNKDKDRLEFMSQQFQNLDLEFDRFEAIYGKDYILNDGSEYSKETNEKRWVTELLPGEIGCALSHKRCVEKIIYDEKYNNIKYLLIMEDDVLLDKNFKNILEEEIKRNEEKKRWNYLQFNYVAPLSSIWKFPAKLKENYKKHYYRFIHIKNIKSKIKYIPSLIISPLVSILLSFRYFILEKIPGIHKFIFRISVLNGCYLFDKDFADAYLKECPKIYLPCDMLIAYELIKNKKLSFYFYSPLLAKQMNEKFDSSIDAQYQRDLNF